MEMISTERSSNVKALGYDPDKKQLRVDFKSGGKYAYDDVPEGVFEAMLNAESIGKFFHANVRDKYAYHRL